MYNRFKSFLDKHKNCTIASMAFGKNVPLNMLLLILLIEFSLLLARSFFFLVVYSKIPKIRPGAYIFQRPFLRGLFLEGLIFGGAYLRREICVSKSIGVVL